MDIIYLLSAIICTLTILIVLLLFHSYKLTKEVSFHKARANKNSNKSQSIELKEFLADLMVGEGLIAVTRVDPNHLFTFSPKDQA